jgi:hypothetical protein
MFPWNYDESRVRGGWCMIRLLANQRAVMQSKQALKQNITLLHP